MKCGQFLATSHVGEKENYHLHGHGPTHSKCHGPSIPRFSTSFAYYGLAMDLQDFGVNIYLTQLIFGAVDFPAKLISVLTITFVGRRFSQAFALILAGLCILTNIFIPQGDLVGGVKNKRVDHTDQTLGRSDLAQPSAPAPSEPS